MKNLQPSYPPLFYRYGNQAIFLPGKRVSILINKERADRKVTISVWYPAEQPEGYKGTIAKDAVAVRKIPPYPVILCSAKVGDMFATHMVSYGFVVVGVNSIDSL